MCVVGKTLHSALFPLCLCAHLYTSAYIASNIITDSLHRAPFPSPLFDLVKHPIISLIIAMPVLSSLPRALLHLPDLLGNPEGDLELNLQPFFPIRIDTEIWAAPPMCLNPTVSPQAYWCVYVLREVRGGGGGRLKGRESFDNIRGRFLRKYIGGRDGRSSMCTYNVCTHVQYVCIFVCAWEGKNFLLSLTLLWWGDFKARLWSACTVGFLSCSPWKDLRQKD